MNTPGGNTVSAAEHTVSMMLSLARNIPQAHMSLVRGEWERKKFTGTEVYDKTLGVVGLGKIGREVAARCLGLGMKILGYDPVAGARRRLETQHRTRQPAGALPPCRFHHCSHPAHAGDAGAPERRNAGEMQEGGQGHQLRPRGDHRRESPPPRPGVGSRGGAALDVFEKEPPTGNPLLKHPRVIATPHLGASTEEAQEKVAVQIAHEIADALHGRAYAGVVNGSAMLLTLKEEVRPYITLAEKLGHCAAQLAAGKLKRVTIAASGDIVTAAIELMKAGVLKGILSHSQPEPVNFINAPFLAEELGLAVGEMREPEGGNYPNLLSLRYVTDKEVEGIRRDGLRVFIGPARDDRRVPVRGSAGRGPPHIL